MISRLIRLPEVERLTSLKKSAIYSLIGKEKFPPQISLIGRSSAWVEAEVLNWIEARIRASHDPGAAQ